MRRCAIALGLGLLTVGATYAAESPDVRSTAAENLPPQALGSALRALALQRNLQIVFASKDVSSRRTQGAFGDLSVDEALNAILRGTGLTYCHLNGGAIAIASSCNVDLHAVAQGREPSSSSIDSGAKNAAIDSSRETKKPLLVRLVNQIAAAFAAPARAVTGRSPDAGRAGQNMEEVVITGSRLQAAGFRTPTPVTVINADTIARHAPADIADVIIQDPAFFAAPNGADTARPAGGQGQIPPFDQNLLNLRALGPTRTLTLLNGFRHVGTNWQGTVDTNIVPIGLVDRVEVVTGGASAAYGSDAVAGVVNIILKDRMQGITVSTQVNETQYSHAMQYTESLAGGTSFAGDRGNVIFGVDANKSDPIVSAYGTAWGAGETGTVSPSVAQRTSQGLPGSYISNNVEPGSAAPGGLYQQSAGVAYTFDANGNPIRFNQGALYGSSMIGSTANYGYNTNSSAYVRAGTSRLDLYGHLQFDLLDNFRPFAEVSYAHDVTASTKTGDFILGAGTNPGALTISVANPFVTPAIRALLPVGTTTFSIGRINTEAGGSFAGANIDVHRIVAGVDGTAGKNWKWQTYVDSGRSKLETTYNTYDDPALQFAVDGCTGAIGLNAAALANVAAYNVAGNKTCVPFNPFGVGRNPASALDYFDYNVNQKQSVREDVVAASLSGLLFTLPAGELSVAGGLEDRFEQVDAVTDPVSAVRTLLVQNLVPLSGSYHVIEAFAETGVPVFKDAAFAKSLDLDAAVRRTDYELSGPVTTWKYGFTWEPLKSIPVRVHFTDSRDIRAPNLRDIFLVGGSASAVIINHIANGVVGANGSVNVNPLGFANTLSQPISQVGSGGGPSLLPEKADTITAGLIFQQAGFRASIDYYHIQLNDAITNPTAQQYADGCASGIASFCQNIVFDPTVPGGIGLVTSHIVNVGTQTVAGYDLEAAYRAAMPFAIGGNLNLGVLINYAQENKLFQPLTGVTTYSQNTITSFVTPNNVSGNQPLLAGQVTVGWNDERISVSVNFRGFSPMRGNPVLAGSPNTILGPQDSGYNVADPNTVNTNRYAGEIYVNPAASLRLTRAISVYANINNLLNKGPPALMTSATPYDLIGRTFTLGARAQF